MKKHLSLNAFNRCMRLSLTFLFCCVLGLGLSWGQTTYTFKKVTNASDITTDGTYLLVCPSASTAATATVSSKALETVGVTISNNTISTAVNTSGKPYTVTIVSASSSNNYYIKLNSNNYLNNTNSKTDLTTATSGSSQWAFNSNTAGFIIQNTSNNNRFLGGATSAGTTYKAYAASNLTNTDYPVVVLYKQVQATPHTVTLHNGDDNNPQTLTETAAGAGVTLPTATTSCPNYTFAGWTKTLTAFDPSTFIQAGTYYPSANENLYAVFSTSDPTVLEPHTITAQFGEENPGWDIVQSAGTSYWKIFQNNYIITPTINLPAITAISVQMGTFGTVNSGLTDVLSISTIIGNSGADYFQETATTSSESKTYNLNLNNVLSHPTESGQLMFHTLGATSSQGLRIKSITITTSEPSLSYTLNPTCSNAHTVTLHNGNSEPEELTEQTPGAGVYLPNVSSDCADYTFVGWTPVVTAFVPESFIESGTTYLPDEDIDLYAVFVDESSQSSTYSLNPTCPVATPSFTPESGTYSTGQNVTIDCTTEGAAIQYYFDDNTTEPAYLPYEGPITLSQAGTYTIVASAYRDGMTLSETATATYTITNAPSENFTVTFDAGTGSCETTSLSGNTITLPTATPSEICENVEGYSFVGWSTSEIAETNVMPTLLTGSYTPTQSTTLYAVYSKTAEIPDNDYHKVTSVPTTWDGNYLIVNEAYGVAFDGSLTSNTTPKITYAGNYTDVTSNNGIIALNSDIAQSTFTIIPTNGKYYLVSKSGMYIGQSSDDTGISAAQNPATMSNYQNNIAFTNGNVDITSAGGAHLRYNNASTQTTGKYSFYKSTTYQSQSPIQLYKQGGSTTSTVYNTNPECHETVATPVISVASGSYDEVQMVEITCATTGAEIRYTTDGSEPTTTSTLYNGSFTINESCTLSAKAFLTDYSSATATATYDLPVFVNSIEEYKAAGVSGRYDENQRYKIMSELTVIGVSSSNIYIQDATGGLMVYTNQQTVPTFEIGDIMENVIGQYELYYGTPEIKLIASPEKSTLAGRPHVNYLTIEQYLDNFEQYESDLICISDVHFVEANNYTAGATGTMTTLIDADNNTLSLYNAFKTLHITLKKDNRASVTGIGKRYTQSSNTTYEISPRDNNDITIKTIYGDTVDVEACERYVWDANNTEYTFSGTKTCIIPDKPEVGYDSVATINLTINHATTGDTTAVACGSFTWHGTTYTETPTTNPTFTTVNAQGCDSVITLHLTIYPTPEISISASPRDYLCEGSGDNITLTVEGIAASQTILSEDFSSCTGEINQSIGNNVLSTFPTLSKIFPADGDIKLGSGSGIGSLKSKALDLSNPFTVTISAKYYSTSENGPIVVTVGEQEQRITDLASEYTDYTLNFDAETANSKITIATTSNSKRAYISDVTVFVDGGEILWSTDEETQSINVSPEVTTTYEVVASDNHNCLGYASKEIIVYPQPVAEISGAKFDTLCPGDNITLTAENADETLFTYQWYKDNTRIEGATNSELALENVTGDMSGDYTVVATNMTGTCKDSSAAVNLLVNGPGNPNYNFTISAPADIYDLIKIGYCDVTHTFENPTVSHYLAGTHFANITFTNDAHNPYSEPGDYTINWIGTDECGNTATCSQVLHISYEPCPIAVDNEGNQYPSVRINCECWTTQNLRSTLYSDGTAINNVMTYTSPEHPSESENTAIYGHLYDWNSTVALGTALNTPNERGHIQGICPAGWYLPTVEQMMGLTGYNSSYIMDNHRTTEYWLNPGDNSSQLSLVPSGQYNNFNGRYENMGGNCYFWDAYTYDATTAKTFEADCHCYTWKVYDSVKGMGFSARCIKERNQ